MTTLLDRFIPEAREHLEGAASGLLKLEQDPSDEGLVNEVFRAVHTLKGASGLFDIPGLTRLVHAGEDLLGAVRSNLFTLTPDIVDALLDALDRVSAWVDELERHGHLPGDADGVSAKLSTRLRTWLPSAEETTAAAAPAASMLCDWLAELREGDRLAAFAETLAGGPPLLAVSYTPDDGCFYRGEDPFNLFPQLVGLKALRVFFREPPAPLSETDPFHSALGFRALVGQPRTEVEHLFRYVLEQVTIVAVPPEALIVPVGESIGERLDQDFIENARRRLAARDFADLRAAIATRLELTDGQLWVASALRWLDAVLAAPLTNPTWASALLDCMLAGRAAAIGAAGPPRPAAPTGETASAAAPERPMAARILAEQMRIIAMPGDPAALERRMAAVGATVANLLAGLGWSLRVGELDAATTEAAGGMPGRLRGLITALENRVEAAVAGPAPVPASAVALLATSADQPVAGEGTQPARVLKVDQAKVDTLMNLIAELVVSKNSLPFLARRAEDVYGSRDMGREIKDHYAVIDRLAQEMQRAIMDVRMLPVSEVFERFPRLVRDLSRKLNKHIDLKIVGEDTAADKTIIEVPGRSAASIWCVTPSITASNRPSNGPRPASPRRRPSSSRRFRKATRSSSRYPTTAAASIPTAIRLKAFEKGMIDGGQGRHAVGPGGHQPDLPARLFDRPRRFRTCPGAVSGWTWCAPPSRSSTARSTLSSRKGEGTMVRLSLPLSMAVARVMMVEVGDALFGVPMDGVAETVRVPRNRIRRIKRSEAFVLRDTIVPLIRMRDLLGLPRRADRRWSEEAVLVARVGGRSSAWWSISSARAWTSSSSRWRGCWPACAATRASALLGDGRGAAGAEPEGVAVMPLIFTATQARFEGVCTVEEALPLLRIPQGQRRRPRSICQPARYLHTALLQLLLRPAPEWWHRPSIPGWPAGWRHC